MKKTQAHVFYFVFTSSLIVLQSQLCIFLLPLSTKQIVLFSSVDLSCWKAVLKLNWQLLRDHCSFPEFRRIKLFCHKFKGRTFCLLDCCFTILLVSILTSTVVFNFRFENGNKKIALINFFYFVQGKPTWYFATRVRL